MGVSMRKQKFNQVTLRTSFLLLLVIFVGSFYISAQESCIGSWKEFHTSGHPKAKNLELIVFYPSDWSLEEGERTDSVQRFSEAYQEDGFGRVVFLFIKDLPPDKTALLASSGLKSLEVERKLLDAPIDLPLNAENIKQGIDTWNNHPSKWWIYSGRVLNDTFIAYTLMQISFYQGKGISLVCTVRSPVSRTEEARLFFEASLPLFQEMFQRIRPSAPSVPENEVWVDVDKTDLPDIGLSEETVRFLKNPEGFTRQGLGFIWLWAVLIVSIVLLCIGLFCSRQSGAALKTILNKKSTLILLPVIGIGILLIVSGVFNLFDEEFLSDYQQLYYILVFTTGIVWGMKLLKRKQILRAFFFWIIAFIFNPVFKIETSSLFEAGLMQLLSGIAVLIISLIKPNEPMQPLNNRNLHG